MVLVKLTWEAKIKRLDNIEEVLEALIRAFCHSIFAILGRLGRLILPLHIIQYFWSEGLTGHHLIKI